MSKSEAQTRSELIDQQLTQSGWNVKDPTQVIEEFDILTALPQGVAEPRTPYGGHQFSDYVLLGKDRKPLAVVEAKKSSKDAAIGREQAKQYCYNIQNQLGGELPFCFYTNGLETHFWDIGNYPPCKVVGFPTRDDLERFAYIRRNRKPLTQEFINTSIAGRDYQIRAIRAVLEGIEQQKRDFLLVMATGTGKTRTCKRLLPQLAEVLTREFGKGFDASNLRYMRLFYQAFPIRDALRHELSWTHYRNLLRVDDEAARQWYMNEAATQNWSSRALDRQIGTLYYERLLLSEEKGAVVAEAEANIQDLKQAPREFVRDPVMLEFLGLPGSGKLLESTLEQALMDKLQAFLLELGKGFAFVARQQRISTESKDFYIDLVFYNYLLKCFVLIDLKTSELMHQDIGQMDMYVRMYDDLKRSPDDNPTVGILLCEHKDQSVVHYSVLNESEQLFASKYRLILPSEEELRREIERERASVEEAQSDATRDIPEAGKS